jgi:hypothetical protein
MSRDQIVTDCNKYGVVVGRKKRMIMLRMAASGGDVVSLHSYCSLFFTSERSYEAAFVYLTVLLTYDFHVIVIVNLLTYLIVINNNNNN